MHLSQDLPAAIPSKRLWFQANDCGTSKWLWPQAGNCDHWQVVSRWVQTAWMLTVWNGSHLSAESWFQACGCGSRHVAVAPGRWLWLPTSDYDHKIEDNSWATAGWLLAAQNWSRISQVLLAAAPSKWLWLWFQTTAPGKWLWFQPRICDH